MSSMITPRNVNMGGGVPIPAADPAADNRRFLTPGGGVQQPQDPLSALRGMFSGSGAASGSGVDWGRYDNPGYDDPALREIIASGSSMDENSTQYYIARVAHAMTAFVQQIAMRNGLFYQWYSQTVDTFKLDDQGTLCPVCEQFIEFFKKRPEITVMIARNASVLFGYEAISRMKNKNVENLDAREYGQCTEVAVRFVLFMEMVSWLTKTERGRSLSQNLPRPFLARLDKLDKFKEFAQMVFQHFNLPFPYENLVFEIKVPTATGFQLMPQVAAMSQPDYGYTTAPETPTQVRQVSDGRGGIMAIDEQARLQTLCYKLNFRTHQEVLNFENQIQRRINPLLPQDVNYAINVRNQQLSQEEQVQSPFAAPVQRDTYTDTYAFQDLRTDFANITVQNREQFDWRSPFVYAGQENKYLIKDELWQHIKRVLRKANPLDVEESMWGAYCYRVVKIDLQYPDKDGYHSYLVRDKARRFTQMQVLTDPAKCLPVLESDENGNVMVANAVNVNEVIPENDLASFIIPANEVKTLDGTIPVVVNTDPVASNNHHSIKQTIETINDRLTSPLEKINATSMDVAALEEFHCKHAGTKARLIEMMPFLFDDNYFDLVAMSYADAIEHIEKTLRFENIEEEVARFIRFKLTQDFNNFLVNNVGFNPDPNGENHLSSSDILTDIQEVLALFERNDQSLFEYLTNKKYRSSLLRKMCMFTMDEVEYEEQEVIETDEDSGKEVKVVKSVPVKLPPVEQLKLDTTLNVCNRIHFTTINRTPSPMYTTNATVTIKRSSFPEIFAILEDGFKKTYGDEAEFQELDKVVRFSHDNNYWLFSPSVYDKNVALLRHMPEGSDLFMLEFN